MGETQPRKKLGRHHQVRGPFGHAPVTHGEVEYVVCDRPGGGETEARVPPGGDGLSQVEAALGTVEHALNKRAADVDSVPERDGLQRSVGPEAFDQSGPQLKGMIWQ